MLLTLTDHGLYCAAGDFFIDPWQPVSRAVVTHAHADHARFGSSAYLCAAPGAGVLRLRVGAEAIIETQPYDRTTTINGVDVSFHPAGHILGSAQVRVAHGGETWVVSGDYKTDPDPTCAPFEPVACDTFITEATFGLPIYRWPPQTEVFEAIDDWWRTNQRAGRASILFAYALGKAQRVLAGVDASLGPIYVHGAVDRLNAAYRDAGVALPDCTYVGDAPDGIGWSQALIVAPPSAQGTPWLRRFGDQSAAFASGWMRVRGRRRRRAVDRGFVLSDHVDWPGLLSAIAATGAERVLVTHGYTATVVRYLREQGLDAYELATPYADEPGEEDDDGMKRFTNLYLALDNTNRTNEKIAAMRAYFDDAPPADAAWAVYFLSGRRPKRLLSALLLRRWAAEVAGLPEWLQEESYHAVGDSAETAALLLPPADTVSDRPLHNWVTSVILSLRELDEADQRTAVIEAWGQLDDAQRYLFNKLITGGFRVGVSQRLLTRALAESAAVPDTLIAHRLMGTWEPTPDFYEMLVHPDEQVEEVAGRPYPFFLAYPLEAAPETLGDVAEWQVEWKWDGIRAQLIRRNGEIFLWSRGEELVTERYPEVVETAAALPDCVIDGELLAWDFGADHPQPFAALQQRIGRKNLTRKMLDDTPVILLAYDLLEWAGEDWRARPLVERRAQLETALATVAGPWLRLSTVVEAQTWDEFASLRETSRERGVEGYMIKRRSSPYRVGRKRGDWWKWKVDPFSVDAVLIYAQRGSGRRAGLYTDYTFALWTGEPGDPGRELVPFAKAYSGLTDAEIREVDRFVRANTTERFGPVRSVTPQLVMEIAFEAIQASNRHKSGVAVRFPRILRLREDKSIEKADTLNSLKSLIG